MSGVSITSNSADLSALVGGGDAFLARIKQFQDAEAKANAALAQLNLGKDLAAAQTAVQATQQAAIDQVAKAKSDAEEITDAAKKQAEEIIKEAQAQATNIIGVAQQKASDLENQVTSGRKALNDWAEHTKADAEQVMAKAMAAKATADKLLAENQVSANALAAAKIEVEATQRATSALQASLQAKLNAVKVAASQ